MPRQASKPTSVVSLRDDDIETAVATDEVPLAEFDTEWYGARQQMAPPLEAAAADTNATLDGETHLKTAIEIDAQRAPTVVLFVDGDPVKQLRGAKDEQTLRDLITRYDD